jgi:uncharacterized protein YgbK (DUF1537 family)
VGILSDDLTGACDVAGYFVQKTGPVRICMTPDGYEDAAHDLSVLNLQSRRMSSDRSREASRRAAHLLVDRPVVFQKIDTAFRGPLGAGLEGLLDILGPRRCVVAPAIPRIGRVTRGGRQYIGGVPVHETEFARDPSWPIHSPDVRENIERSGAVGCEIRDAATSDDLERILDESLGALPVVLVGSLGLAEAVAGRMVQRIVERPTPPPAERVLVVSGSPYRQSHLQLEAASRALAAPIVEIHPARQDAWPRHESGALIARIPPGGIPPAGGQGALLEQLTVSAATRIRQRPPEGLAIIGGETAFDLLGRIGATGLWIHGVLADVVSFGTIQGGILDGRPCMLKGGSVGPQDAVIRMVERLAFREGRSTNP